MGLKSTIALQWALLRKKEINADAQGAVECQSRIRSELLKQASSTAFSKEHRLREVSSYTEFKEAIPVRDYEDFSPYINRIRKGEQDVLWKGAPLYWAKTSGTTSGTKYIPITKESLPNHINTARDALFCYIAEKKSAAILNGKMIFLSGSPRLEKEGNISIGRLSGIAHNHIPAYLQKNRLPSYEVNCIEEWEKKLDAVIEQTAREDMRLISGIPPWAQMYFDKLQEKTGKNIKSLFPNFSLFIHGGVNIKPYRARLIESIGGEVDWIETFPASEGFMAYQDTQQREELLLNVNSGIFFEFIPVEDIGKKEMRRYSLEQVSLHTPYAILLSTNAGLWAYNIGDIVEFTSLSPYRIVVKGRTKHFISAFGEHVIAEEVEDAMMRAAKECGAIVTEFTVAPYINDAAKSASFHEWLVEFEKEPSDLSLMESRADELLCKKNSYYNDLIRGKIISPLRIRAMKKGAFIRYMKSIGKLGEQNKVPHVQNDRKMADALLAGEK